MRNRLGAGLALAVGAAVHLAVVGGCGSNDAADNPPGEAPENRDVALVTREPAGADEPTAIVGGVLRFDSKRGCASLSGRPVVWPSGTTLHGNAGIRLPNGVVARAGARITGTGGVMPASSIASLRLVARRDLTVLERCTRNTEVVVFTASGDSIAVQDE